MKTITILFLLLPIFAFSQSKVEDIQTIKTANSIIGVELITDPTGLELISEEGNDGWRLIGANPDLYGSIGNQAIDLSINNNSKNTHGATGDYSFASGNATIASGVNSFASGVVTTASGKNATAMGKETVASGASSFASGMATTASNYYSTAMGYTTIASGSSSFATGNETTASGNSSFTQGEQTTAQNTYPILPIWGDVRRTEGLNNQ